MNPRFTTFIKQLHQPRRRHVIFGSLLLVCGLITFGLLYTVVAQHSGAPTSVDRATLDWMISHRDSRRINTAIAFTHMLAPAVMFILAIAVAGFWFLRRKEVWRPTLLLSGITIGYLLVAILKDIITRARPPIETMIAPIDTSFSFPSAHTAGVALCALIIGYLIYSRHQSKRILVIWIETAVLSIGIVLITRLLLGYHWLTDVSASLGLALFVFGLVVIIDGCYTKKTLPVKQ